MNKELKKEPDAPVNGWVLLMVCDMVDRLLEAWKWRRSETFSRIWHMDEWRELRSFLLNLSVNNIRAIHGALHLGMTFINGIQPEGMRPTDMDIYGYRGVSNWENMTEEIDYLMENVFLLKKALMRFLMACDPVDLEFKHPWGFMID